jgi:hypothetical protein
MFDPNFLKNLPTALKLSDLTKMAKRLEKDPKMLKAYREALKNNPNLNEEMDLEYQELLKTLGEKSE